MIESEMVGKRIRVINLAEEPDIINQRYSGRTGIIDYVDDIGQYHIKWDDGGTGGLAVIPDVDDFEILDESVKHPRTLRLLEGKVLTSEEKMDRWHNGKRKENIKACSDEKLAEYLKICRKKGYTEQVKLINAERKVRKVGNKVNESYAVQDVAEKIETLKLKYKSINTREECKKYPYYYLVSITFFSSDPDSMDYSGYADPEEYENAPVQTPELEEYRENLLGIFGYNNKYFGYFTDKVIAMRYAKELSKSANTFTQVTLFDTSYPGDDNIGNAWFCDGILLDDFLDENSLSENLNIKKRKNFYINESFDNAELTKMIADHDGLKSFKEVRGNDARGYESSYDLKTAVAQCYIPKALANYFGYFNVFEPLVNQILYCNDGGIIVISKDYNRPSSWNDPEYPAYEKKMRVRNNAFREKYGEPHFRWTGVDKTGTTNRRMERHGLGDEDPFFSNY